MMTPYQEEVTEASMAWQAAWERRAAAPPIPRDELMAAARVLRHAIMAPRPKEEAA